VTRHSIMNRNEHSKFLECFFALPQEPANPPHGKNLVKTLILVQNVPALKRNLEASCFSWMNLPWLARVTTGKLPPSAVMDNTVGWNEHGVSTDSNYCQRPFRPKPQLKTNHLWLEDFNSPTRMIFHQQRRKRGEVGFRFENAPHLPCSSYPFMHLLLHPPSQQNRCRARSWLQTQWYSAAPKFYHEVSVLP